ncbi:MAG: cobalamin B12-binding domain-containing protein, partial [Desulfosudaceae bacterium]
MIPETTYRRYLAALLAGDRAGCAALSRELLETGLAPEDLYTDLFQRSLYEVGELWEQNRVSVAVEHLATAVTESLLAAVYPHILGGETERRRKAVISCSVNEYHQVGARMVADIMETRGWDTWFLGANTPTADLLRMLQEKVPDMLGLSVSIYFNMAAL